MKKISTAHSPWAKARTGLPIGFTALLLLAFSLGFFPLFSQKANGFVRRKKLLLPTVQDKNRAADSNNGSTTSGLPTRPSESVFLTLEVLVANGCLDLLEVEGRGHALELARADDVFAVG